MHKCSSKQIYKYSDMCADSVSDTVSESEDVAYPLSHFASTIDFSVSRPGTDVVLVAEGKEIHVNKEVLSTFSPYFRTLLQSPNFIESSTDRVEIDYSHEQLLQCVKVVYHECSYPSGSMDLGAIEELLRAADRFDLAIVRRFGACELMRHGSKIEAFFVAHRLKMNKTKKQLLNKTSPSDWLYWRSSVGESAEASEEPMFNRRDLKEILKMSARK